MRLKALLLHVSNRHFTVGLGIGIARAAGFLTGAVVARALGPERFAAYTVAFTLFSSLVPLTSFADTWMVSRWEEHDQRAVGRIVWTVKLSVTGVLLVASLAVWAWWPHLPARIGIDGPLLLTAIIASAGGAFTSSAASWYQANQDLKKYAWLIAVPPCVGLLSAVLLRVLGASQAFTYTVALLLAYAPTTLLAYRLLAGRGDTTTLDTALARSALMFGGWVTVGSLSYVVFQRVDTFLLAAATPSHVVGLYGAATRLSMVGGLFGSTLTAVLMPIGSRSSTWSDRQARHAYMQESLAAVALMTFALGIVIVATGPLMNALFGSDYADARTLSRILLLSQIILIAQLPFYFALYALEGSRWIAGIGLLQTGIAITSGYLLIQRFGAIGAAWSNVVTYSVGALGVIAFHLWSSIPQVS